MVKFAVTLVYDHSYGGYVADVPQLPGCMSQGKSIEEALANIKEAITLYIEEEKLTVKESDIITAVVEV